MFTVKQVTNSLAKLAQLQSIRAEQTAVIDAKIAALEKERDVITCKIDDDIKIADLEVRERARDQEETVAGDVLQAIISHKTTWSDDVLVALAEKAPEILTARKVSKVVTIKAVGKSKKK